VAIPGLLFEVSTVLNLNIWTLTLIQIHFTWISKDENIGRDQTEYRFYKKILTIVSAIMMAFVIAYRSAIFYHLNNDDHDNLDGKTHL
jgi:hypothetical protein